MKKYTFAWLWLVVVAVVLVFIVWFLWRGLSHGATSRSGTVSVSLTTDGGRRIEADVAGYSATVPENWYVEPRVGGDVAVYPDHSATSTDDAIASSSLCKIELSVFPNMKNLALDAWLNDHLSHDPLGDIVQSSMEGLTVADAPAIRWDGTMDGASTTVVYVGNNSKVYEIAPSTLQYDVPVSSCENDLQTFLGDLHF